MGRDAAFARLLEDQADRYGLAWLAVDGSKSIAETGDLIGHYFEDEERV